MQIFQKLDLPISLDEFVILDILIDNEEICQRDLAKLILKDRPCTGRLLNSLEEKGFIKTSLGSDVLRTETVPLAVASILKYLKEWDKNGKL